MFELVGRSMLAFCDVVQEKEDDGRVYILGWDAMDMKATKN